MSDVISAFAAEEKQNSARQRSVQNHKLCLSPDQTSYAVYAQLRSLVKVTGACVSRCVEISTRVGIHWHFYPVQDVSYRLNTLCFETWASIFSCFTQFVTESVQCHVLNACLLQTIDSRYNIDSACWCLFTGTRRTWLCE